MHIDTHTHTYVPTYFNTYMHTYISKDNVPLKQATKAQKWSRGIALLFL